MPCNANHFTQKGLPSKRFVFFSRKISDKLSGQAKLTKLSGKNVSERENWKKMKFFFQTMR